MSFLLFPEIIASGQNDPFSTPGQLGVVSTIPRSINIDSDIQMQIGAFHKESYAQALRDKLSVILDKTVTVISENGYFKVRLIGISDPEEAEKVITVLGMAGINNIWILPVKKQDDVKNLVSVLSDTTTKEVVDKKVVPPVIEEKPVAEESIIALQVGVFHQHSKALRVQKRISTKLKLHVEVVQEYDYYQVIITGFSTIDEANKSYPRIEELGYPDISLIKTYSRKR